MKTLDHPATSNEVRDKFGFKLRAPARKAFRKLESLGYGKNIKSNGKYNLHVAGKVYPEPPKSPTEDTPKNAKPKEGKA